MMIPFWIRGVWLATYVWSCLCWARTARRLQRALQALEERNVAVAPLLAAREEKRHG